jgi:hypothetical protein
MKEVYEEFSNSEVVDEYRAARGLELQRCSGMRRGEEVGDEIHTDARAFLQL